jgi:subtilase family serine protease
MSVLITFAFSGSALATTGDDYTLYSDSLDEEMIWGDGVQKTSTPLHVEVTKQDDHFQFEAASEAVDGSSEETVTFDVENDGTASYQIQHQDGGWEIAYPDGDKWPEFESLPHDFVAEMNEDENAFTVSVPIEELETDGPRILISTPKLASSITGDWVILKEVCERYYLLTTVC